MNKLTQLPLVRETSWDRQVDGLLEEAIRSANRWSSAWSPQCNVYEDPDSFGIQIAVPGMDVNDFDVQVDDQTLRIHGDIKSEERPNRTWHTRELNEGAFSWSFRLPAYVDTSHSTATYAKGILTMRFPKREQAKPRRILIE